MMDLMYTVPSDESIESCVVTKDVIDGSGSPEKFSYRKSFPVRSAEGKERRERQ